MAKGYLKKLTNDLIDDLLKDRSIKRMSDYRYYRASMKWMCLIEDCGAVWEAAPTRVIGGLTGCPKCNPRRPFTNELIDEKLQRRPIKRIGDFINIKSKFDVQCSNCSHIWPTTTIMLFGGRGCPKCKNQRLNNVIVDEALIGRSIKRLGDYINNHTSMPFQCEKCNYEWYATFMHINAGTGCPICSTPGQNEKMLYRMLQEFGLSFEYDYDIRNINHNAINKYRLDVYYPQLKFAIEYNGKQHYRPSDWGGLNADEAQQRLNNQQARDRYITQFCENNNIHLIWIDGREYIGLKLRQYVAETIIPMLILKSNQFSSIANAAF